MSAQIPLLSKTGSKPSKLAEHVEETIGGGFHIEEFVENFEVLAEASGGIANVRQMALQLAFQGRFTGNTRPLVPAVVRGIHEALSVSRGRAATTTAVRGASALAVGMADMLIPEGWEWLPLVSVARLESGHTPSRKHPEYWDGGIPWIGIRDAKNHNYGWIDATEQTVSAKGLENSSARLLPAGTVCLSRTASVGYVTIMKRSMATSQDFVNWVCGDRLLPEYLMQLLRCEVPILKRFSKGAVHQTIYFPEVKAFHISLPSLGEQKRIVAKVDELMRLIDELEAKQAKKRETQTRLRTAALDALTSAEGPEEFEAAWKRVAENFGVLFERAGSVNDLRRGILELGVRGHLAVVEPNDEPVAVLCMRIERERCDLLHGRRVGARGHHVDDSKARPEPYLIPRTWSWCVLEDVAGHIVDGTHHTPKYVEKGCDFISAKDIRKGAIIFEGCRQITTSEFDELRKRCSPKRDHVLVTKSGSIGEVAVVGTDRTFTLFESVALVPVVPSVNSRYAAFVIHLGASGQFGAIHRKGIGVPHLHLVDLRRLPFPLPSRQVQDRIVARVEQLLTLCDDLEANLRRSEDSAAKLVEAVVAEITATGCV